MSKGILPHLTPVPIDDYFDKWVMLYKRNISDVTRKHYEYTSKAIKEYFGSKPLQEITRHDYQMFINDFGSGRAKETVEKVNSHIRACVKDAIDEQIIHRDFTRKAVITYTVPPKKSEEKHLNYKESETLLKEIWKNINKGLSYSLLLLGLTSGMRFGEMIGLTRKDFDFKNNTVRINKTWGYMKRNPEGFGPTKNQQSVRTITMNPTVMAHFKKLFKTTPTNIHQLVFYSPNSKYKVISNTYANKLLKETLNNLGIKSISMHGLRHTHASLLLYKNISIHYVSERLGHGDIETTLREYTHVLKELREKEEQATIEIFEKMNV